MRFIDWNLKIRLLITIILIILKKKNMQNIIELIKSMSIEHGVLDLCLLLLSKDIILLRVFLVYQI